MKTLHLSLCALLGLSACASQPLSPIKKPQPLTTEALYSHPHLKGKSVRAVADLPQHWLLTSETEGLLLINPEQQVASNVSGNYESLDTRSGLIYQGSVVTLIATRDNDTNRVALFTLNPVRPTLTPVSTLQPTAAQPETICLYQHPTTGHVSVFVVDTEGMVTETLVYDGANEEFIEQPLRQFIGVPEAQSCVVDDREQALFIAEGEVGIWQYPANAEKNVTRKAVAMTQPFGKLAGEISGLDITADGSVWALTPKTQTLHRYLNGQHSSFLLNTLDAPEGIAVAVHADNTLAAAVYDDNLDAYVTTSLPAAYQPHRGKQHNLVEIKPAAETQPMDQYGDAADDPAIWINTQHPAQSLILGTNKRAGLMVYGLNGELLQSLAVGRVNNVDVRQHPAIANASHTLITASNRTTNSISVFDMDNLQVRHVGDIATSLGDIYGLCQYQSDTGSYVFVNDKNGTYQQYQITQTQPLAATLVREFAVPSQPEGCAADDTTGLLYVGEEDKGIWVYGAEPASGTQGRLIKQVGEELVDDVEGIDIYHNQNQSYLVVSSQGNDSYVVYGLWDDYPLLTQFRIGMNLQKGIDGVSETDGLTVTSTALPGFPSGLVVAQDGHNRMPTQPQNFKLVDWRSVQALLPSQSP